MITHTLPHVKLCYFRSSSQLDRREGGWANLLQGEHCFTSERVAELRLFATYYQSVTEQQ